MGSMWPQSVLTHVFSDTVTNTDIALYVFLHKAFLTMTHTFARFCVFPFNSYLCLFPLGHKWTPLYLPCSIDNCPQNAQNAVCVSASIYIQKFLRQSRAYLSISEYKPVLWNIIWGEKNIVINCVCILVFFTVRGSYWPHGSVNVTFFMVPEQG